MVSLDQTPPTTFKDDCIGIVKRTASQPKNHMRKHWQFVGLVIAAVYVSTVAVAQHVVTESGALAGISESGLNVYKGVPFAAPPIGDLRWRPRLASPVGRACIRPIRSPRLVCRLVYPCRARSLPPSVKTASTSTSGRQPRARLSVCRSLSGFMAEATSTVRPRCRCTGVTNSRAKA